jgi:hypothetical protein
MSKASGPLAKRNPLPSKEASLFKELLTLYETRQLKKGLKTADLILKKFPDHGGLFSYLTKFISTHCYLRNTMHERSRRNSHGKKRGRPRFGEKRRPTRPDFSHLLACLRSHPEGG